MNDVHEIIVIEDSASPIQPTQPIHMRAFNSQSPHVTSNVTSKRKRRRLVLTPVSSNSQTRKTRSMTRAKKNHQNKNKNKNKNKNTNTHPNKNTHKTRKRPRDPSPDLNQPSIIQSFAKKLNGLGDTEWKTNHNYIHINTNKNTHNNKPISPIANRRRSSRIQNKRRKLNHNHTSNTIIDLSNEQDDHHHHDLSTCTPSNQNHAHNSHQSHTKMSLDDDESDVELIQDTDIQMIDHTNTNSNSNNKISLINDNCNNYKLTDIDINDIEIKLIGIAIGKHHHFWTCKEYDIAPKLIINKHTRCIDLYLASIHGDNVCVSIKTDDIKALYIPQNPQFFDIDELQINPSNLDLCEEDYPNVKVNTEIQVVFMQTEQQLLTYQWLAKYYDPKSLKQPGCERISLFMGADEFNALQGNWWLNKTFFADLSEKVKATNDDEKDLWIKHIFFPRNIKRYWKKYDTEKTKEFVHHLLYGEKSNTNENENEKEEEDDDDIKKEERIDIIDDEDDAVSISIDGSINFGEYICNGELLLQPHHSNSLNYAASRSDCPSKTLVCYWVFPAQHEHRQCIMHIESKDYIKVTIEDEYLNDTIVDFQLKYTYASWPAEFKEKVYIFTSFFWKKLVKMRSKKTSIEELTQVLRWTKHIKKLFEKEYIIIPKCEHQHWELVIICYPGKVLQKYLENEHKKPEQEFDEDEDEDESKEVIKDLKTPCIAILDSLLGTRKSSEFGLIRKWLNHEATNYIKSKHNNIYNKNKMENGILNVFDTKSIKGYCCKVPKQPNGHDCGCFLLRNVLQFGIDYGFKNTSCKKEFNLSSWYKPKTDGVGYRKEIASTIARLIKEQKGINEKLRVKHENQKKRMIMKQIQTNKEKENKKKNVKDEANSD